MPLPQVQRVTSSTKLGTATGQGGYRLKPGDPNLASILRNPTTRDALAGSPAGPTAGPLKANGRGPAPVSRAGGTSQKPSVTGKG